MIKQAVILAFALGTVACGYALAGRGSFLPDYIRVVGIPPIENRTTISQVDQIVTNEIRSEFIGRGKYRVEPGPAGAQAVLSGAITSITLQPVGFTQQQLATRYLLTLTMRVQFTDATTTEILWSNDALTFRQEYDIRGNPAVEGTGVLDQDRVLLERVSKDVARTVVTAILEAF
jgi:hypothetical protein